MVLAVLKCVGAHVNHVPGSRSDFPTLLIRRHAMEFVRLQVSPGGGGGCPDIWVNALAPIERMGKRFQRPWDWKNHHLRRLYVCLMINYCYFRYSHILKLAITSILIPTTRHCRQKAILSIKYQLVTTNGKLKDGKRRLNSKQWKSMNQYSSCVSSTFMESGPPLFLCLILLLLYNEVNGPFITIIYKQSQFFKYLLFNFYVHCKWRLSVTTSWRENASILYSKLLRADYFMKLVNYTRSMASRLHRNHNSWNSWNIMKELKTDCIIRLFMPLMRGTLFMAVRATKVGRKNR